VLTLGFGFLGMFLCSPKDWHVLVPGIFFLATGAAIAAAELGYVYRYDVVVAIKTYWPVAIIGFGVALITRRFLNESPQR
jgi:hypothetical protein